MQALTSTSVLSLSLPLLISSSSSLPSNPKSTIKEQSAVNLSEFTQIEFETVILPVEQFEFETAVVLNDRLPLQLPVTSTVVAARLNALSKS